MRSSRDVARAKWIANFDMESLISLILRSGMWISLALILSSIAIGWVLRGHVNLGPNVQAKSIVHLIRGALRHMDTVDTWPNPLIRLAVAALLLTPYVRVLASMAYFTWVDRSRTQILFTGFVLTILTIILLTSFV